ncbi:hypothetical protein FO519_005803 [Halicephalobus sp. NKZ332]|nr:hypothetical protein FO519_005803 [Halicephalobus sp. NKZ332]
MKKCTAIGMSVELLNEPPAFIKPSTSEPSPIAATPIATFSEGKVPVVDWVTMISYVKQNLSKEPDFIPMIGVRLTELQRFQLGLNKLLNYSWPQKNHTVVAEVDNKQKVVDFYILYILHVAQLMVCSESMMKLSLDDRFSMFKHFWINFQQIERLFITCQIRGYDINDTVVFLDKENMIDMAASTFTMCPMSEEEKKRYYELNVPLVKLYFTYISTPFKLLKTTQMELAFIAILILWDVREVKNLSSDAVQLANEVIDKVSLEMHQYYTSEMRNPIYSDRITKLTKIAHDVQRLSQDRRNLTTMAQMFNLFNTDLSDNELLMD